MVFSVGGFDHRQVEVGRIQTIGVVHGAVQQGQGTAEHHDGEVVKHQHGGGAGVEADFHGLQARQAV